MDYINEPITLEKLQEFKALSIQIKELIFNYRVNILREHIDSEILSATINNSNVIKVITASIVDSFDSDLSIDYIKIDKIFEMQPHEEDLRKVFHIFPDFTKKTSVATFKDALVKHYQEAGFKITDASDDNQFRISF